MFRSAGVLISLDVSDVKRLGSVANGARALRGPRMVIDHHVPTEEPAGDIVLVDTAACTTGEMLYDLADNAVVLAMDIPMAEALYLTICHCHRGGR